MPILIVISDQMTRLTITAARIRQTDTTIMGGSVITPANAIREGAMKSRQLRVKAG